MSEEQKEISKSELAKMLNVPFDEEPKEDDVPETPEPAVETKVEQPALDDFDLSDVMEDKVAVPEKKEEPEVDTSTKEGRAFANMRKQIKELTAELEEMRAAPKADPEETEALRKELEEKTTEITKLYDQIGQMDLSKDPRFVKKYSKATSAIEAQITDTAKEFGLEEDAIKDVMRMSLRQRAEYLGDEIGAGAPLLLTLLAQRDSLVKQRDAELAQHEITRAELDKEQGANMLATEQLARTRLFQGALANAKQSGHFAFQESIDNPKRTELAKFMTNRAAELFASSDGEAQAQAMLLGVAAPIYLRMLNTERSLRVKAEKELERRFGVKARIGGTSGTSSSTTASMPEEMSAEDAAAALMAKFQ